MSEEYQYAKRLAEALAREHWPENTGWEPLPDLLGVLTQIDNMTTLMRDQKEIIADKRRLARLIDVGMFGDGAAKQASLCDLVEPAKKLGRLRVAAKRISDLLAEFDGDTQYIDQELWDELWDAADAA